MFGGFIQRLVLSIETKETRNEVQWAGPAGWPALV